MVISFIFDKLLSKYSAFLILFFAMSFALGKIQFPTTTTNVSNLELNHLSEQCLYRKDHDFLII